VPLAKKRTPLQGVSGMEDAAKGAMGRGAKGDGQVEESVEDPGSTRRQEMRTAGAGLPHLNVFGKAGAPLDEDDAGSQSQSGSSGSAGSGKRNRGRRQRRWVLREDRMPRRNNRCSSPRPPSWYRPMRSRGRPLFLCHFPL